MPYRGDVRPQQAWSMLGEDHDAVLVDVRTRAEWTFVGVPDLTALGKTPLFVEWQTLGDPSPNPEFVAALESQGVTPERTLLFLCRSGGRSAAAANELTGRGYAHCYNVVTGFEGDLDTASHRGMQVGWKADGLPWRQS